MEYVESIAPVKAVSWTFNPSIFKPSKGLGESMGYSFRLPVSPGNRRSSVVLTMPVQALRDSEIVAILEDDTGGVMGDTRDAVLYRVQLEDETKTNGLWRDLRPF